MRLLLTFVLILFATVANAHDGGWHGGKSDKAVKVKIRADKYPEAWVGDGRGKVFVLYRTHNVKTMRQGPVGSCVGTATAKALELRTGKKYSAEWAYALSRSHFGDTTGSGSHVVWAAQAMRDVGPVRSRNYTLFDRDLRKYNWKTAKSWEARGPPEEMLPFAEKNLVTGYVRINTWEKLRDAIANRNPVIVGSSIGFGKRNGQVRSSSGMLRNKWSIWKKSRTWNHAMVFCGVGDGKSKRVLVLNSWGPHWVSGPKWLGDEPDGSFWISKYDAQKMLIQGDAWAMIVED